MKKDMEVLAGGEKMLGFASYFLNIIIILCWVACFYFTLTFFQQVRTGEERLIKQSMLAAVCSLALALILPIVMTFIMRL